jgi:hypothetical protein
MQAGTFPCLLDAFFLHCIISLIKLLKDISSYYKEVLSKVFQTVLYLVLLFLIKIIIIVNDII